MTALAEALGLAGSVVSLVLWWPQALRVWRSRRDPRGLEAVSVLSQVLLLGNAALWAGYGLATGSLWVGAPGLVNGPLALATIVVLRRSRSARRTTADADAAPAEGPLAGVPPTLRTRSRGYPARAGR